jgi:hypothetical protein
LSHHLDEDPTALDQWQMPCRRRTIVSILDARKASRANAMVQDATLVTCIEDHEKGRPE